MAAIKGANTKPELKIRKSLHRLGYRYRLHIKHLPGTPDIVLRKHNAVIFINGCFWHMHDCEQFKWPKSRLEFWTPKLHRNAHNDAKAISVLVGMGWRVAVVWECALKGKRKPPFDALIEQLDYWLKSTESTLTLRGAPSNDHHTTKN